MRQRLAAGGLERKRRKLGTLGQRKLNRCWSKGSWMDSHKKKDAKLNTYSVALLISSPSETAPHLPPKPLSRVYTYAERSRPLAALPRTPNLLTSRDHPSCRAVSPCQLTSRPFRGRWWHGIAAVESGRCQHQSYTSPQLNWIVSSDRWFYICTYTAYTLAALFPTHPLHHTVALDSARDARYVHRQGRYLEI